jgi:AcrR family transcriptional regulator
LNQVTFYNATMPKSSAPSSPGSAPRRRYSSQLRSQQAGRTRAQVLAAAGACFEESGWAGTTVAAVAKRAGVAVETVYSGFGSKKQLLRQAIDVAVVGDTDPVPLAQREVFTGLGDGARDARIDAGIEMLTDIHERIARLWRTVGEAAASDPEIDGWRLQWEDGRRVDTRRSLELILEQPLDDVLVDVLWGVFSHEFYAMLVFDRGLDRGQYTERVHQAVHRLIAR